MEALSVPDMGLQPDMGAATSMVLLQQVAGRTSVTTGRSLGCLRRTPSFGYLES